MSTVNIDTRARFAERLEFLCAQKGIAYKDRKNLPRALAVAMVDSGIVPCVTDRGYEIENTRQKIRGDLEKDSARTVDHLDLYCRFFGCSADFLMGYIDTPTHEEKVLKDLTALSDTSCRALLEKEGVIIRALDLLLPDIQKAFAYIGGNNGHEGEIELSKYSFFSDIGSYLLTRRAMGISSGFEDIEASGSIFFGDESGNLAALDPRKISAIFMLGIQEELQRIRDDIQNKNKAPA